MRKEKIHLRYRGKYKCNWAVSCSPMKMTSDISKVTCKNCKRIVKNTRSGK